LAGVTIAHAISPSSHVFDTRPRSASTSSRPWTLPDSLPPAAKLRLERGQRRRLRNPAEHAEQELVDEFDRRRRSRAPVAGNADRAQPRSGVLRAVQAPLVMAISVPDRSELEVDPVGDRGGDQRTAAPGAMLLEPLL
jgi:hypothetical protein